MFGGAYGNAHMPNWPHWHRTPLPGIFTTGLRRSVSLVSHKYITCVSQVINNKAANDSQMGVVTQKWQALIG